MGRGQLEELIQMGKEELRLIPILKGEKPCFLSRFSIFLACMRGLSQPLFIQQEIICKEV